MTIYIYIIQNQKLKKEKINKRNILTLHGQIHL